MSELSSINLILGIVGTVTGIIALFIHFWRAWRENPRLQIKSLKCEHDFAVSKSEIKTVSFWVTFQIKNLGDRGTSINDIDLFFVDEGKEYHLKKKYFRGYAHETERRWINAHETFDIDADFYDRFEGSDKQRIDCTFTIYHTHGAKKIKALSEKRNQ